MPQNLPTLRRALIKIIDFFQILYYTFKKGGDNKKAIITSYSIYNLEANNAFLKRNFWERKE